MDDLRKSHFVPTFRPSGFVLLMAGLFLGFSVSARADSDPHATGLRPPSAEQKVWERAHMIVPRRVKLNALGLSRVNSDRIQKGQGGLPPSAVEVSAVGLEVEGLTEDQTSVPGAPALAPQGAPTALPPSIDNSTLKYFPPIRSQGSIGSCAQWAGMYYCFTHMNALARDLDAKNGGDAYRFSPKFTYNLVNGGVDAGSWQSDGWSIAAKHGAATWADWPYNSDFRGWPLTATVWRNALNVRVQATGYVYNCDTPTGLDQLKTLLVNGYVLTYATYINSWQYKTISNDPGTSADDAFVGKNAGFWISGTSGGHAMTVVGYNDAIWVDINGNGTVDAGEKGALRIANSWGSGWQDGGFTWLAYDALKSVSGVAGGPSSGRGPAWWGSYAMWVTAKPAYTPKALAQFTLSHLTRNQLRVSLGLSDTPQTIPATSWSPSYVLQQAGGAYAFNGGGAAVDGEFVLDYSDIAPAYGTPKRWYLRVQDTASGNPTTVKAFKWINVSDSAEVAKAGLPVTIDNTLGTYYVDATMTNGAGNTPPTISTVPNQGVNEDNPTGSLSFTVGDTQTAAGALMMSGASSNVNLVPSSNIVFGGTGASRTVVVTPAANRNGSATLTLTVTDGGGLTAQTSFTLTVSPVNDAPVALAQTAGVLFNTPKAIVLQATDDDGDLLTYTLGSPAHGALTGTAPNLTYTPNTGYAGLDGFPFTVSDGSVTSPPASVSLVIDTTPPTVVISQPLAGATVSYSVFVSAAASDNVGVARVVFFVDGVATSTATGAGYSYQWDSTRETNGVHVLTARAFDDAGNNALSGSVSVTVNNTARADLVVTPTALSFHAVAGGGLPPVSPITISDSLGGAALRWAVALNTPWLSASALSGIGEGIVSIGANPVGLAAGVYVGTVTVSSASPGAPRGNGDVLVPVTLTVDAASDLIAPSVPTGLAAVGIGAGRLLLSWSPSTDTGGSGMAGYRLFRDGLAAASPTAANFTDTGLVLGSVHSYAVLAYDNAGNQSGLSGTLNVTVSSQVTPAGLSEAYSYPDPAMGGAAPVIRAVLGDVDNVEITLYDARGHPVHSARLDGPTAVVNGKAAFDYTWPGEIASGVYYAVIHGRAGSENVIAKTRVTVVR
ncbi:MAG: hypothetical protein IPP35_03885 [Elusimicrobia bacterium]|nr:hypothetical protein [Elusimicrobiota bacterium]